MSDKELMGEVLYRYWRWRKPVFLIDLPQEKAWEKDVCIDFCNETFWKSYDWKTWIKAGINIGIQGLELGSVWRW